MFKKIQILITLIYQELWGWNKSFSQLSIELLKYDDYLENGKYEYLVVSKNMILVKHERIKDIPSTLKITLAEFWCKPSDENLRKSVFNQISDFLTKVRNVFWVRPDYLKISSNFPASTNSINAQIGLIRSNGKMLLFDVENDFVYVKYPKNDSLNNKLKLADRQFDFTTLRQEISKFFSLTSETKMPNFFYKQDLVYGDSFSSLQPLQRLQIIKQICHSSICSAEKSILNPEYTAFDIMEEGFSLAMKYVDDAKILEYICSREQSILEQAKSWALIPSHCDVTAHNITIINKKPILLDAAPHKLGFMPPFFAPICLMHSEFKEYGRSDLVESFLDGELDDEFSLLLGVEKNSLDKAMRFDLLLAETLSLAAKGNKIIPQNIDYWFTPIFNLLYK